MADGIIEARITYDFLNNDEMVSGYIHSKFKSAINIYFNSPVSMPFRLITVVRDSARGIPDSLIIDDRHYSRLELMPVGAAVRKEAGTESFRFILPDVLAGDSKIQEEESAAEEESAEEKKEKKEKKEIPGTNCLENDVTIILEGKYGCIRSSRIPARHIGPKGTNVDAGRICAGLRLFIETLGKYRNETETADGFSDFNPDRKAEIWNCLENFCAALIESDSNKARKSACGIAGAGRGLTPSADDALLGVMAAYTGAVSGGVLDLISKKRYLSDAAVDVARLDDVLTGRTTDISMKYLCCAQEGRFSDAMAELAGCMFLSNTDAVAFRSMIMAAAAYGATSGADMLTGVAVAAGTMIKYLYAGY